MRPLQGYSVVATAEGEGFEPSRERKPPTAFPVPRTRPDYAIPPKEIFSCRGRPGNAGRARSQTMRSLHETDGAPREPERQRIVTDENPAEPMEQMMRLALDQARRASEHGDVPIGAVILDPEGTVVSYTHLRAHETDSYLVCRLLLEKKKKKK